MTVARTPLFFGENGSLFGWYHEPAASRRDLAVVICPPLGHEYINSHRPVRHLADRLAAVGIPALRFDYHGTGDSDGRDEDPARLAAWMASVQEARRVVRELSRCTKTGLIGIRMGATLAALASRDVEADCLVLWGACVRGRTYARELKALHLTGGNRNARTEAGAIEPGGFVVTEETQREIGCLDLEGFTPRAGRTLIVVRDDLADDTRLCDAWTAADLAVEQRALPGFTEMFLAPHNVVVPDAAIDTVVEWVAVGAQPAVEGPALVAAPARVTERGRSLRESTIHVDAGDGVFGIVSEPACDVDAEVPIILLPNAGSTHHVGPNRLYVLLARALSSAGFRCVRFDLPGLGDSVVNDAARENDPYLGTSSEVIRGVIDALRQDETSQFVVMGLCSGAHAAFHAALDLDADPIVECVLINPLTFYYKPGMSLDQADSNHYEEWQRYMRSMRSLEGWGKLLREDVRLADIGRNVALRFRDIGRNKVAAVRERLAGSRGLAADADDLDGDIRRIAESGRRLTFVFSRFDPGHDLLMINGGRAVKDYGKRDRIRLWRIDEANHTFEAKRSRDEMIASLTKHLVERYRPRSIAEARVPA